MIKRFSSFVLTLISIHCLGQSTTNGPELPQLLPPTPEAAAITKGAEVGTGIYTGMATATIPIYDFKSRGFTVPISLNYSSSGFKVDELPSRVGMGWSIGGGGVISRIIHDRPDDKGGVRPPSFSSLFPIPTASDYYYYYKDLAQRSDWDTEPDEFIVSAPGLNTKFIFDDNGNVILFPYSNIKVEVEKDGGQYKQFTITNTEGIKYVFGGGMLKYFDIVQTHNLTGNMESHTSIRTGFYLRQIILKDGSETFTYDYTSQSFGCYSGVSQWSTRGDESNASKACLCDMQTDCSGFPTYGTVANRQTKVTYVVYNSPQLTSISNGTNLVVFGYDVLPGVTNSADADSRITSISISAGNFNRTYQLQYFDPSTNNTGYNLTSAQADPTQNPRYFLKEVSYTTSGINGNEVLKYKLDYNDINSLPKRLSFAQDWVGYYNGKNNNDFLASDNSQYWVNTATANKAPDWNYSVKGMLQRITLPTGGYQEFVFEANTHPNYEEVSAIRNLNLAGSGSSDNAGTWQWEIHEANFEIFKSQTISVDVSGGTNPGCSGNDCSNAPSQTLYYTVLIQNLTTSDIEVINLYNYGNQTYSFNLNPGLFKVTLKVRGLPNAGTVSFSYDIAPDANPVFDWVDHEVSGVRVKQIKSFDPVTNKNTSKYFKYASKNLLQKSTSSVLNYYQLTTVGFTKIQCGFNPQLCYPEQQPIGEHLSCKTNTIYSSSLGPVYLFGNNHIIYSNVIESDDPSFANGGIEHQFSTDLPYLATTVRGQQMHDLPFNTITSTIGKEISTDYFDNSLQTVRRIESVFEESDDVNTIKGYTGRRVREFVENNVFGINPTDPLDCFDESTFEYKSYWERLKETTVTEYTSDNQSMVTKSDYLYGDPLNILPVKTQLRNSKNDLIETENKYPTDYPSTSVYQTMVSKNIISPVVQSMQKSNNVPIVATRTAYRDWFNDGKIIEPETIFVKRGNYDEKPVIQYFGYDVRGNVLEVAKANDFRITYLWGYDKKFPIAEIKNTSGNVYYSSFEENASTEWPYVSSSGIISANPAITGNKYYNGTISISFYYGDNSEYYITYWTKNTLPFITSTEINGWPKPIKTLTRGGDTWTLYEHKISGAEVVTLNGTGSIDELRSFSVGSQITTYSYSPYVGMSSVCDANNKLLYYEYDAHSRLHLIKDQDLNILKMYCYNYFGQPENCGVKKYLSEAASGNFTPVCSTGYSAPVFTYNVPAGMFWSTISQLDANQKATNYVAQNGQAAANATCVPVACSTSNCEGKCINGVCDLGTMITIAAERRKIFEDGIWVWRWYCTNVICYGDGTYTTPSEDVSENPCNVDICQ